MLTRSLVVLSLTAALLAGCGDDEPTASTPAAATTPAASTPVTEPAPEPTKSSKTSKKDQPAWVADVNKRCKAYAKQTTKVFTEFSASGNTSPEAATKAMESVVPLGKQMVADLRQIDAEGAQEEFDQFLDTLDSAFVMMPEITKSLASGKQDPALMKKLAEIETKSRPFADKYDLDECLNAGG